MHVFGNQADGFAVPNLQADSKSIAAERQIWNLLT
jgi:hypothetical protein